MKGYDMGGRCLTGSGVGAFLGGLVLRIVAGCYRPKQWVGVWGLVGSGGVGWRWRVMVRVPMSYMAC